MSLKEDLDTLEPEAEAQKAFDESAVIKFGKEKMHPWTMARHSAAMSMGCQVISAIGPSCSQMLQTGTWPNALKDVVIMMWIASLPEEEVLSINYSTGKEDIEKAFKWAEKVGLKYGNELYLEGVAALDNIVWQILVSNFSVEKTAGSSTTFKKSLSSQPGKSNSRGRQPKQAEKQQVS